MCKILKNPYFEEHLRTSASDIRQSSYLDEL